MAQPYWVDEKGVKIKTPPSNWQRKMRLSAKRCHWCKNPLTKSVFGRPTIDHILPRANRGPNRQENCVVACRHCNEGRATTGHCIVTLFCVEAIVGRRSLSGIARHFQKSLRQEALAQSLAAESLSPAVLESPSGS